MADKKENKTDKKENKTNKKEKKTNYYTSREKSLVPSKKKSVSQELYGKQDVPTYEGEVKIKKTKKPKKDKITIGDIIRGVTGRGEVGKYDKDLGLNKGGRAGLLQGGIPKLAKKGWK